MVKDTTKDPHPEWLFGRNPNAIEAQEALGQKELCRSQDLPRTTSSHETAIPIYEKMGIIILDDKNDNGKNDNLFVSVQLPEGWKIVPTEHHMWNKLVDVQNRTRAQIFYKAAFYDRSAHITFNSRYHYEVVTWSEDDKKYNDFYEKNNHTPIFGRVLDQDKVIFETVREYYSCIYSETPHKKWWEGYEKLCKSKGIECKKFLDENYPNWKDIAAYW